MKIDAEMKILTKIQFEWKTMAFSNNYSKGDDSAAGCGGDEGEDYLQDSKTFRLRVRLTVLSKGSQEIWG